VLEYVAAGGYRDVPDVHHLRSVAAAAADQLRAFLDDSAALVACDLVAALEEAASDAQLLAPGLDVRLVAGPIDREPDAHAVSELAAATREALANVRRHSGAVRATVRCAVRGDRVMIRIEDDGVGFLPGPASAGHGIRGSMMRRLRDIGGSAFIESEPGRGTVVRLVVDLRDRVPAGVPETLEVPA
jgi:signal transduction histidine kinase